MTSEPFGAQAGAEQGIDRITLRDHVVEIEIGAFHDEFGQRQRLGFDIEVEVLARHHDDDVDSVLSYDLLVAAVGDALAARRVELLETLAEDIAARILASPQAGRVFLRIEKLDRANGRLGVEIVRSRGDLAAVAIAATPPRIVCVPDAGAVPARGEGSTVFVPRIGPIHEPDRAARRLALLALDQAAVQLGQRMGLPVVASRTELEFARDQHRPVVWAPSRLVLAGRGTPGGSDGADLAAWLARELGAAAPQLPVPATPVFGEAAPRLLAVPRPAICGVSLDRPRVMGILNITPDSFSDGGDHLQVASALDAARQMAAGCDFLDVGGESTRPGAEPVPEAEELRRILPVIAAIRKAGIGTPISIDTRKAAVAAAALDAGADLVNDVSALTYDSAMAGLVAERGVPLCLMHAQGDPRVMQVDPRYDDVVAEVRDWLAARVAQAEAAGIARARILVDPGIGFGKTVQHNVSLLRNLGALHGLGCALLLGASRKRFIGTLGHAPQAKDRLAGSLAVAVHAATQGVHVLRVHDVAATRQALDLWLALTGQGQGENGA